MFNQDPSGDSLTGFLALQNRTFLSIKEPHRMERNLRIEVLINLKPVALKLESFHLCSNVLKLRDRDATY